MDDDQIIWDRLIFAIPELKFDDDYVQVGIDNGWISEEEGRAWKTANRRVRRLKNLKRKVDHGTPYERIMRIMPEIMSVRTVDFLRGVKIGGEPLLGITETNALRAVLLGSKKLRPTFAPEATMLARLEGVFDAATSSAVSNLIRDIDTERIAELRRFFLLRKEVRDQGFIGDASEEAWRLIAAGAEPVRKVLTGDDYRYIQGLLATSIRRAQILRSLASTGKLTYSAAVLAREQHTVWGAVTVLADRLIGYKGGERILKDAVRAGVIPQSKFRLIRALEKYGFDVWKKVVHGKDYESWVARSMILSEGILSDNLIKAVHEYQPIPKRLRTRLYKLSRVIRGITRAELSEYMKSARFRVLPGESPIKTFSRIGRYTDSEILRLLRDAAKDTQKDIDTLMSKKTFGRTTRARQQQSIMSGIHTRMREVWEDVGTLTIFGEREAAQAAWAAEDAMFYTYKTAGQKANLTALRAAGRAGLDAWISREENFYNLSRRVYKNIPLSAGWVEREVQKGLIRGLSASELAGNVAKYVDPNTPGGVSYAAMRLARTEINNAFHFSQIRHTREMPWVEGYKWNLSGSHPSGQPDVCNSMSEKNHDNIGRGVYRKANIPGKPHPHCLCYITNVTMDNKTFERRLTSGAFDKYIDAQIGRDTLSYSQASDTSQAFSTYIKDVSSQNAKAAGASVAIRAWSGAKTLF